MRTRPKYRYQPAVAGTGLNLDELWVATALTDAERAEWREAYEVCFGQFFAGEATFPERAQVLARYGWRPDDLRNAIARCGRDLPIPINDGRPERGAGRREQWMDEAALEAHAALVREVVQYMDNVRFFSAYARDRYMWALARHRWTHSELGVLFGLTKQRVQQLLKRIGGEEAPRRPWL